MSTDAERRRLIRQDKRRYSFTFTGLLELRAGFLPFEARSAHLRGEAHWEVRLAAVHVEAQREEARYTVLGTLQPLRQPQLQFLGLYRPQNRQKTQGLLLKCHFCGCLWMCGLKHPGNPVLRFNPVFLDF